jgi:molecular chaperone DnaK
MVVSVEVGAAGIRAAADPGARILTLAEPEHAMASALYVDEHGQIVFGGAALRLGCGVPERLVADLGALFDDGRTIVGDRLVDAGEIAVAVVRMVHAAAVGDSGVDVAHTRLVVPGWWGPSRSHRLAGAIEAAGLGGATFVERPIAHAFALAHDIEQRSLVAICDVGANGVECSVVARGARGFELVAAPTIRPGLGGNLFDRRLLHALALSPADSELIARLRAPASPEDRGLMLELWAEVRRVKERLGESQAAELHVPGGLGAVQVTRDELTESIRADIDDIADALAEAISSAGARSRDLAAVALAGGSARIPLVSSEIWRRLDLSRPPLVAPEDGRQPADAAVVGALRFEPYRPVGAAPRVVGVSKPRTAAVPFGDRLRGVPEKMRTAATTGERLGVLATLAPTSRRGRLGALGSIVAVIVLVVVLVAGGGGAKPGHGGSATPSTGSKAVAAAGLGAVVPAKIAATCTRYVQKGSKGVTGAVQCDSDDANGPVGVTYTKFTSAAALSRAFAVDMQIGGVQTGTGDCNDPTSFPAQCAWSIEGESGGAGELAYYNLAATNSLPAAAVLEWTITKQKTLLVVIDRTVSDSDLRNWFVTCGGPGGSAVATRCASGRD